MYNPTPYSRPDCFEFDKSINSDLVEEHLDVDTPLDCQYKCSLNEECFHFVWITPIVLTEADHKKCLLHKEGPAIELLGAVAGPKKCT
ncbi:hypothetical protein TCAL_16593 [Tigriopus californicus]|uniref:Apple domain-containing protein n=1 Tax=Tigriopus californicus TaxID=6832 RepID=A0A553NBC6_TIGCA|nr:hypothetical protein TCAL_16593 [Tigriopus californicus]